jgi:hypothetical protein
MTIDIPNSPKPNINWDIGKRIFVKDNVIDPSLCDDIIKFGDNNVTENVNKYAHLFSTSFHSCLLPLENEAHENLQSVWKEVIEFFNMDIDFVEPYELKRYTSDDYFGRHIDNYYSLTVNVDRKITFSVQLSNDDEYEGGEFNVLGVKHKLKKGSVIAFPSFFPHEIEAIKSGTRWSLIGWAWGPYWR